jgi:hypothetical protein
VILCAPARDLALRGCSLAVLPSIYAVGWINLYDEPPETYCGLLETDGEKKPGYFAWKDR